MQAAISINEGFFTKCVEDAHGIRDHLHQYPEVGRDLPKTRAFLTEKLQEYGLDVQ